MSREAVLELVDVYFGYGDEPVLAGLNLSVPRGHYLGLVGANGSGKTTLVKIALGLLRPQRGSSRLFGEEVGSFRNWRRVGYVAQGAGRFEAGFPATVWEVVFTGRYGGKGLGRRMGPADRAAVERALELVNLGPLKNRRACDLSGGEQQRVSLARALAGEPELLVLDEPTAGIDVRARAGFYELLARLNSELGITILLVSHDLEALAARVRSLAWLRQRILFEGPPARFLREELGYAGGGEWH